MDHLDAYLAACQLGITISSIGLGFVAKPAFEELIEPAVEPLTGATETLAYVISFAFAFGVVTLLHVVFGELAPKSLAIARNTRTALVVAPIMRAFYSSTKPLVDVFNWMGNLVLRPFGVPPASEAEHAPHSERELRVLLRQSVDGGLIDVAEHAYTENVFAFGDLRARQVMVPRSDVDFVTTTDDVRAAARMATATGHTRLPLCDPDKGLDAPVGVVNAKDLLDAVLEGRDTDLVDLARPLRRVPDSILIQELLRVLRSDRRHLALVVDELGTTIGLVSLEDIIEELVGEIEDEFDTHPSQAVRVVGGETRISGQASLRLVAEELGLVFVDRHESTIGGHILETVGRLPEAGEPVQVDGCRFEVLEIDEARILEVRLLERADD